MTSRTREPKKPKEGEVILDSPSKPIRSRKWAFTLNNWTEQEYISIWNYCKTQKHYIIGKEVGELGTPHLQGFFESKNTVSNITLKNLNNRMHLTRCRGNNDENLNYCSKDGNYVTNMTLEYVEHLDPVIDFDKMYDWQSNIVNTIKNTKPNNRTINWYYDPIGNKGKTTLCKYLLRNKLAMYICSGKSADIKYILSESKDCRDLVFDFNRSIERNPPYALMEELKNGILFNTKYEGSCKEIATPHIFIFANFLPDLNKLSQDRWNIIEL